MTCHRPRQDDGADEHLVTLRPPFVLLPVRPTLLAWLVTAPAPIALNLPRGGITNNTETTLRNIPSGAAQNSHANTHSQTYPGLVSSCNTILSPAPLGPTPAQLARNEPKPIHPAKPARVPDRKTVHL